MRSKEKGSIRTRAGSAASSSGRRTPPHAMMVTAEEARTKLAELPTDYRYLTETVNREMFRSISEHRSWCSLELDPRRLRGISDADMAACLARHGYDRIRITRPTGLGTIVYFEY